MNLDELLKNAFNIISWINENIFVPLNGNIRIDAFIGIVGVLIAIVIFIAETMKDKKVETQKSFILEKTKIKRMVTLSIIVLSLYILKDIIPYGEECTNLVEILFFITELLVNIFIYYSIYLTLKLFWMVIKLNTENDYFFNEYDKYIKKRLIKIHNKNISYSNRKIKNESVSKFVKDNNKYFSFEIGNLDDYEPVKAHKTGIFKSYSCRSLQTIIDKMDEEKRQNKEVFVYTKPLIILNLEGGEKLNRGATVAYCLKNMKKYEDIIRNSCLLNDSIPFNDNEITLIINDLYLLAETNINDDFDFDSRLFNYYNFLYDNNMRSLLDISYEHIRKVYIKYYENINKNKELADFLSMLISLAYSNEDYERYKFLSDYIYYCYTEQLNLTEDIRKVSYNYTNSVFRYDYYSVKENGDSVYYDVLLSNLMKFLFDLIKRKEFNAINDLFNNVIFDYNGFINEEPDSYDIIKMQFSFGFIYGLIILSNKDNFNSDDKNNLKSLINYIKRNFVDIHTQNDVIEYFRKYFNLKSNVYNVYDGFDFKFENKEYRNSWSGVHIGEVLILKEYLYIFNIEYSNSQNINSFLISKDNKYFYENLLEIVRSEEKSKLDNLLEINMNKSSLIELLEELVKKCKHAEKEYIKNNKISNEKKECFKKQIFEEIEKGNGLISYLKDNGKYKTLDKKNKRLFGFNQIIGRELFFDNIYGLNNIAKDYGRAILTGIVKDYLKKLDSISEIEKSDFIKYIKKLESKDDYMVITSPSNWRILNKKNFDDNTIKIDGKKIDVIEIPKARDIYLIKKKHLPKVEMCEPDIMEQGTTKNGIYYDLIDCSINKSARNKVQEDSKWLEEEGNIEEQIEYLKGKCIFKLFISPAIRKISNSRCYKFVIKEE